MIQRLLADVLMMSIPYVCASLGGVLSERSGVVNITLEGTLLGSALAAVSLQHATSSATLGVCGGIAVGALIGLVHAWVVVVGRIHALVSGLAINMMAAGVTRLILRTLYGSSSNSPSVKGIEAWEAASPLVRALAHPSLLLTCALVASVACMLQMTRFGLAVRASGEDPDAAHALGIDVVRTRLRAVTLGGAVTGFGGAAFALGLHQFQAGMTAGRGFVALCAVIVGAWRPLPTALACLGFALLEETGVVLQSRSQLYAHLFSMFPHAATLFVLAMGSAKARDLRRRPPMGLGKHPSL